MTASISSSSSRTQLVEDPHVDTDREVLNGMQLLFDCTNSPRDCVRTAGQFVESARAGHCPEGTLGTLLRGVPAGVPISSLCTCIAARIARSVRHAPSSYPVELLRSQLNDLLDFAQLAQNSSPPAMTSKDVVRLVKRCAECLPGLGAGDVDLCHKLIDTLPANAEPGQRQEAGVRVAKGLMAVGIEAPSVWRHLLLQTRLPLEQMVAMLDRFDMACKAAWCALVSVAEVQVIKGTDAAGTMVAAVEHVVTKFSKELLSQALDDAGAHCVMFVLKHGAKPRPEVWQVLADAAHGQDHLLALIEHCPAHAACLQIVLLKLDKLAGASIEQREDLYLHACKYLGSEGDVRGAKTRAGLGSVECIRLFVDIGRKLCLDLGIDQYLSLVRAGSQHMAKSFVVAVRVPLVERAGELSDRNVRDLVMDLVLANAPASMWALLFQGPLQSSGFFSAVVMLSNHPDLVDPAVLWPAAEAYVNKTDDLELLVVLVSDHTPESSSPPMTKFFDTVDRRGIALVNGRYRSTTELLDLARNFQGRFAYERSVLVTHVLACVLDRAIASENDELTKSILALLFPFKHLMQCSPQCKAALQAIMEMATEQVPKRHQIVSLAKFLLKPALG